MAGGFPSFRVHQDGGVDAVHVGAVFDEKFPPGVHEVFLQGNAEGAVVPSAGETAVNVASGENEATSLR